MLSALWSGLGSKLAERWITVVFSPAFGFWAGGLAAWTWRFGRPVARRQGWDEVVRGWTASLQGLPVIAQGTLAVGLLLAIAVSGVIVARLSLPVLRLLEGYWPRRLAPLRSLLIRWQAGRLAEERARLRALAGKGLTRLSAAELAEYRRLDRRRRLAPARPEDVMPTRLGNVLRAAEERPAARYGLGAVVCWPRLWLVLPEGAREDVAAARANVNQGASLWLWGVLFIGWTIWAWWALPIGMLVVFFAYRQLIAIAAVYGELVESCFDLYRRLLYDALGWPSPPVADEVPTGRQLTKFLWRGPTHPAETPKDGGATSAPSSRQTTT